MQRPSTAAEPLDAFAAVVDDVVEGARRAAELPPTDQAHAYRHLLRADVHDVVMRATTEREDLSADDLAPVADAVCRHVPQDAEARLSPRVAIFVRLLRVGALQPAWMLAHDNASGVVRPERRVATWAGGSYLSTRLPLPTQHDGGQVFAWLPGFRDPRWHVPDAVYEITDKVVLRAGLDLAVFRGGALVLAGTAYLGQLEATPDDEITLRLRGPGGETISLAAERTRSPDLVKPSGPDLTRIAWGGWSAHVDLDAVDWTPGTWWIELRLGQHGLRRGSRLARSGGPLVPADPAHPLRHSWRSRGFSLAADPDENRLVLLTWQFPSTATKLARRGRRSARLLGRAGQQLRGSRQA